ncbi:cytospin-B [Neosynchiropus ocellatus]
MKAGLPKPGQPERAKQSSVGPGSSSNPSSTMKTSKSSHMLTSDQRHSKLKRANSDDALTKPTPGPNTSGSRMKKTVTTGAISDLAKTRPSSLSGVPGVKKTGIPAPRDVSSTITRDRLSLREQLKTSSTKRIVSSASTSSLSTMTKQARSTNKSRQEVYDQERALLESRMKELLDEAKVKDMEISNLKMELHRCKEKAVPSVPSSPQASKPETSDEQQEEAQVEEALVLVDELREKNAKFQRELAALREENQGLKEKLLSLEVLSPKTTTPSSSLNTVTHGTPPVSSSPIQSSVMSSASAVSSTTDITKDSPSPDSFEFENIPFCSESVSSSISGETASTVGHDVSVMRLTEQIHQMEESHHCTSEELQATLQELADQQQVVQELTAENERLAQEKCLLQTSLQQQRERVDMLSQKNDTLTSRLQEQVPAEPQREADPGSQGPRLAELDQKYAELVENSHFEREKLVNIQQQLTSSLRVLEKEHHEAQTQVLCLQEEVETLQAQLEKELEARGLADQTAEDHKVSADCLRVENSRLRAQVDIERQKVVELMSMQSSCDNSELQSLLKTAHTERDSLEVEVTEVRQRVLQAQAENDQVQAALSKVEAKCRQIQAQAESREQELLCQVTSLEQAIIPTDKQVKEMKETIFELEDQVEQQRAINLHTNQNVIDLENLVKRLQEQKADAERQLKVFTRQMKEEKEDWHRFQADLQTAVVVANDIKVEAQQELRALRRQLQEEQDHSAKLSADLEALQGLRSAGTKVKAPDADARHSWCGSAMYPTTSTDAGGDADPEFGVKSVIKAFDADGPEPPSPRSPFSGIPVRSPPAAAISPMQVNPQHPYDPLLIHGYQSPIKCFFLSNPSEADTSKLPSCKEETMPTSLMRKSPSLESVIKSPFGLSSRAVSSNCSSSCSSSNSRLSVERKDPLAALAQEYGGSKRNALLKWCQKKTEGYLNIDVTNFSSSWSDGLALCALLHTYLPAHIPYQELISQDKVRNLTLAFQAAESVGIKPSLNMEELTNTDRPNWQSVMHYVSQIYRYFET